MQGMSGNFIMDSRTIFSATTPADAVLTVDSSSSIVVDSTSSSAKVDSCSASSPPSVVTVTDSDVPEPAMAVLHTIASSGYDGAEASHSSATQEHIEQIDASSDELEILKAESVAAMAAVAAADARLRFLRARHVSAQASQASARSGRSAPGPAMRPFWLPAAEGPPDRGPLATVSLAPSAVRRAAERAHRTAFRQQEKREEKWEKERHDRERQERRCATDNPFHLSGQRVLEASGVDFAGNVVVPELPPVPVAATPANVVLLPLQEEHLRDSVHQQAPRVLDQDPRPAVHLVTHSRPSYKSSVIAQLKLRISALQSRLTIGGGEGIPVPDSASCS